MLKDTGASVLKKKVFKKIFQAISKKKTKRKVFKKIFHVIFKRGKQKSLREYSARFLAFSNYILTVQKKNSAVLEPRTEKFSRT